ncbi:MAG: response regulator [Dehalococcoidia bacterium]
MATYSESGCGIAEDRPGYLPAAPILVVDDEPDIRTVVRMCLEGEGYTVSLAVNGRDALERITTQRPAVILLDLNMPVMTGWELVGELRARCIDVPVLFMSAGRAAKIDAERYGVAGWLPKPFDLDELLDCVQRAATAPPGPPTRPPTQPKGTRCAANTGGV